MNINLIIPNPKAKTTIDVVLAEETHRVMIP